MCLQGASAVEKILAEHPDSNLRVFVVWERALITDRVGPNTRALRRISDSRTVQFWDKRRLLSRELGEAKNNKMIWDWVALYPKGATWNGAPPQPVFTGRTVVASSANLDRALQLALAR